MDTAELLTALKWNLKLEDDFMDAQAIAARDAQLQLYIDSAIEFITREGADVSVDDGQLLIVLYAAWLYDHPNAEKMPRAIRWNLNDLILDQHLRKQILIDKISALLEDATLDKLNKLITVLGSESVESDGEES